ncbi:type II CRISPR RNA-guided endonuclease Cas9 [Salisediminibacterium halotolerans]|uniref:type II CRISPR RNA-guided endonuclease Cas9 n=1 Tax=Salisediminibacterium halotolerans TaxID=517425 RepID=UPI000EB2D323|nr:type II CRISPR RNA-guided endonuclease Cas9 [Salisediminibacterium halotolerans]RLJ71693.1 CRISPR-associated endonuclease Csn1 [Actinophytocola xinjiangensis]RPE86843.1 CRISPR-associated Csn1 family endonuclease [Salisediminibacterium halotolerans]TWG32906.1 CRISPR-associated Csn1 family endonuclease [Salisediminibacterium halotolerans]GEL07760.1 hypothetical protein SHA02_11760 [Salisediminibacterium halotolerans]
MANYTFGLDIGIGSVGFGVIDEDMNIIESGVRLFPEADVSNNDGRRAKRGARRLQRRRKHRKERLVRLLQNYGFDTEQVSEENPYELRAKGLYEPLNQNQLIAALYHLIKRRGVHNVTADLDDEKAADDSLSTKDQIKNNEKQLQEKYVAELQLERLQEDGEVRGHKNRFKTEDYVEEAKKLLETQQTTHGKIDDAFIKQYIELLETRRAYYEGPGFGSPFGWEQDTEKWFRQMMGKCSYFPEETRAVKESYSAQLFNVLNDLNNLSITRDENDRLTEEEKAELLEKVFKAKGNPTLKKIAKIVKVKEEDIKGYRIDKKGKPEFTVMKIAQELNKIDANLMQEPAETLDQLAEIVTVWQDFDNKLERIKTLDLNYSEHTLAKLAELNFGGTHALSLKAIQMLLPDLWATNKNQMELFTEYGLKPKKIELKGKNKIPHDYINDLILSPVVKRAFVQSIRIVNALIEKHGEPREIVIELAREKNSSDRKTFLNKMQKQHEAINKQVREKLDAMDLVERGGMFDKLRLWHFQDGQCLYSLKPIELEDLINNPSRYEIDHIIPRSVSFDDSQANKVLVHTEENQKKGNLTPYQYLKSGNGEITYEKYKSHVLQLAKSSEKMSKKKREYLLEERDLTKYDVQKEFINRNLVDTRYATREIMTLLKAYFKENEKDVIVKPINGSFTNYLRKLWGLNKDRDEDFKHHAQDALVVSMAGYLLEHKDDFKQQNLMIDEERIIDKETGEIMNEKDFAASFTERMNKVKEIKEYPHYKYSHRTDQKPNRQLMNDTIYSTRETDEGEYIIGKMTDLYDPDNDKIKKQFHKSPEAFLMFEHDEKTFEKLTTIMKQYDEAKNPLAAYYKETGNMLTKYSKKDNGPPVKSLKYRSKKLGEHKDLSHKFDGNDKRVVTLSLKPYRMDVFYEDNRYKFVTVRFDDLHELKNKYFIPEKIYQEKMAEKSIEDWGSFQFSVFKNDILRLSGQVYKFIGVNEDKRNVIECDLINQKSDKRLRMTVKKEIADFRKFNTNVLGDHYVSNNEKLKLEIQK